MTERWDRNALRIGIVVTIVATVPPTLVARFASDDQESTSGWAPILLVVTMAGFVIGGAVAARRQEVGTPLSHAVVTAAIAFVIVQAAFIIYRLVEGSDIRIGRVLVAFTLAAAAGLVGGLVGTTSRPNRSQA